MSIPTFETLPDEILMIIIRYSGDIYTIFRTYSGLNQRINSILVDKRTHLLSDFLFMNNTDIHIDDYYHSQPFHDLSQQLTSMNTTEKLRQCLQSLVAFHIQYRYRQSEEQLKSHLEQFSLIRSKLSVDEFDHLDKQLAKTFKDLKTTSISLKQIEHLVLIKGARLECPDGEHLDFNYAEAVNHLLLSNIVGTRCVSRRSLHSLVHMFKSLLISNLDLLYNQAYVANGGCVIYFFLFYTIYRCQSWNCQTPSAPLNVLYYQAVVDLLLFALQCLKYKQVNEGWWIYSFLDLLTFIHPIDLTTVDEIVVYTSQIEILKIVLDQNIIPGTNASNNDEFQKLTQSLANVIKCNRLDLISFVFRYSEDLRHIFQQCWNDRKFLGTLTGNRTRRRLFHSLLDDHVIGTWLATNPELLFLLLQKKECQLVKKLINRFPLLIYQLDDEDNDPLLYVCLHIRGCRHRLVEYLIKMGCNVQRKNLKDENFIDALKLIRNRKLLEKLMEEEVIQSDPHTGEIEVKLFPQTK